MADDPIDRAWSRRSTASAMSWANRHRRIRRWRKVIRLLREMGVDFAQGYGVAKPRPFVRRLRAAASGLSRVLRSPSTFSIPHAPARDSRASA